MSYRIESGILRQAFNLKNIEKQAKFSMTKFAYCSSCVFFCHALAIVQSFSCQAKPWPRQGPTICTVILYDDYQQVVCVYPIYTLALL